jgi:hypothetical protein
MKTRILSILFLIPLYKFSFSQNYCSSVVCDKYDSTRLSWVTIYLKKNASKNSSTDSTGRFIIYLDKLMQNDSICLSSVGYINKIISIDELEKTNIIYLERSENVLPEVQLYSTNLDWESVIRKSLEKINVNSKLSFESNFEKQITLTKNGNIEFEFEGSGNNFEQGINVYSLLNNRNQFSWTIYSDYKIEKKPDYPIFDYNGNILLSDTYFENRTNKYLLPLSIDKYNYKKIGIVKLDSINVYKIESTPKSYFLFNLIDKKLFHNLYKITKAKKVYYINSKTFEIIRIDFSNEVDLDFSGKLSNTTLERFDGTIQFYNNYNTLIPLNIFINHYYKDERDSKFKRTDLIKYSNITLSDLNNNEIMDKYNLRKIYGNEPNRQIEINHTLFDKMIFLNKK